MPCPFTGHKMFCAGPKCLVPVQKCCARPKIDMLLVPLQNICASTDWHNVGSIFGLAQKDCAGPKMIEYI